MFEEPNGVLMIKSIAVALLSGVMLSPSPNTPRFAFDRFKLDNGLRVILSPDHTAPVVAVYVIYGIGARAEEEGRSGFAHLFEHMMFQGSKDAPKGMHFALIEGAGGWLNASTHLDFTDYFQVLPSNQLPVALWLEADRMRELNVTEENFITQREAVKEERRLRVDNQPYASAILDRWPTVAFQNPQNARSVIGTMEDLDAATLEDVQRFFDTYYVPNNAVLVIVGDIGMDETRKWVETYFGDIPAKLQPRPPDLREPPQTEPRLEEVRDPLAPLPALIVGYRAAPRRTMNYYAMGMLDIVLTGGESSRLYQGLVKGRESVVDFEADVGWPFADITTYRDPALYTMSIIYKPGFTAQQILEQVEEEIARIQKDGVTKEELERARNYFRSERYGGLQPAIARATLLGRYEIIDRAPDLVNIDFERFLAVTPKQIQAAAKKYLVPEARSALSIIPGEGKEQ